MRLLNSRSRQLELLHRNPGRYAIVSHRWGDPSEEVLFTDIGDQASTQRKGRGYEKILLSCAQAVKDGLDYVWLDTCCIDKRSSSEVSEAINSMYRWYEKSEVCYAYLHDVTDPSKFVKSEWFSRGWTLQELIAPKVLKFFTKNWTLIGTRENLIDPIAEHTGISREILQSGKIPKDVTISERMFWAGKRETGKVEDKAYSLLGILGVRLVANYGIDDGAFEDLQRRIIETSPDQTLFAWYYTPPQPEDVEMADANPPPDAPPDSAPDSAPESVEGNATTPVYSRTGFLASSPSQFPISYDIDDQDFCKNYVDPIRDITYRPYFSFSNNSVNISLPVKYVKEKLWKAVLRCSFEPPGDEPQRPLVIYLEEIQPWRYIRVHLVRNEVEEEGDNQTDDVNSIPGSLERLSDAELKLEGYKFRDIHVTARHEESPSDAPQRPPPGDPDSPTERSEADRIAQLPRHPPGVKTTNIIVCGEPGVAAGRVVNLIMGDTIIKPLTDYDHETMAVTVIDVTLQSKNIRIFYTIGPRDPFVDLDVYHTVIRNMYQLVQHAKEAGGIHLVLLCIVGSRITRAVESNYRIFNDYVCRKEVPMMLIVTGLGKTKRMEDWWDKHSTDRELQNMRFLKHACITVLQGEDDEHERKYKDSTQTIQELLMEFMKGLETTPKVFRPEDVNEWFVSMGRGAQDLLLLSQRRSLRQEAIATTLKEGINLDEMQANALAGQFFDKNSMEL